jgi:hypothetical protein
MSFAFLLWGNSWFRAGPLPSEAVARRGRAPRFGAIGKTHIGVLIVKLSQIKTNYIAGNIISNFSFYLSPPSQWPSFDTAGEMNGRFSSCRAFLKIVDAARYALLTERGGASAPVLGKRQAAPAQGQNTSSEPK